MPDEPEIYLETINARSSFIIWFLLSIALGFGVTELGESVHILAISISGMITIVILPLLLVIFSASLFKNRAQILFYQDHFTFILLIHKNDIEICRRDFYYKDAVSYKFNLTRNKWSMITVDFINGKSFKYTLKEAGPTELVNIGELLYKKIKKK